MRRTKIVTIPGTRSEKLGERDNGKTYLITEMSAADAEAWALQAITLIGQAGVNLPEGILNYGMAGLALLGLDALIKVDYEKAAPLLKKMMDCVKIIPNPENPIPRNIKESKEGEGGDIEEVSTRLLLRNEVFELHTGFSADVMIRAILASAEKISLNTDMQTSQQPSEPV